ncbi:CoA transferase subunit A [Sinanaerobacter chloroacetimidivorans]|jgi:acetate CoA/acetoacetate CoA-transferase alpha subunit|uniref:CoA transferase subunit A n=1 Tax=Sinanaerobacter chloroacetimidivorans TaxID=2818044 RepID=A0A8J7W2U2_9FIRM|nr:CoA transferase subunit A [Sinanaerobacter chloroacetimidivorans]MBR0599852.1 CoA transferase subunit A [Sinanaerobacter chloroacetimidivorans]
MKSKMMTAQEAVSRISDGATVMVGGFMACGTPEILIDALVERNVKNLTIICNDAGVPGRGVGKLLSNGQIKTLIASHVGLNPEVAQRMNTDAEEDKLECILVPQGTLAERIRAGGAGLGGFLTPTGVGTIVAEGKQVINVDGRDYLLEKPLKADFALIRGSVTDQFGNTLYNGTTRTFNPMMATAADYVIVGTCEIVEIGEIDPNSVVTSGIFVDAIVGGEQPWQI